MEDLLNTHHQSNPHIKNKLLIATALIFIFSAAEAISGVLSHSLVLLSDASHTAADGVTLALAAFAAWMSSKPSSRKHTYGFGRAEVIVTWFSSLALIGVIIIIFIEAIHRLHQQHQVNGNIVMLIAASGFLVNMIMALLLGHKKDSESNINVKSALLHILTDIMGCSLVLISGALIYFTNWHQIDPIFSIIICVLILFSTIKLLRESLLILMEGVPKNIDPDQVQQAMATICDVKSVHDIHIWTLTSNMVLLTAHVVIKDFNLWPQIIPKLQLLLKEKFAIMHATMQPEVDTNECDPEKICPYCKNEKLY